MFCRRTEDRRNNEHSRLGRVYLVPDFAAKKWPMKELQCSRLRRENANQDGKTVPFVIPIF